MAKTETFINEFKINYLTSEQYQEALASNAINDDELYMTQEDMIEIASDLVELHVWNTYTSEPFLYTEETVTNMCYESYFQSVDSFEVVYSDTIKLNHTVSLFESKKITSNSNSDILKGKYIKNNAGDIYYIPTDATFTYESTKPGIYYQYSYYADKAIKFTPSGCERIGFVVSDSKDAYPTNGEQDGVWYVYNNKFGETSALYKKLSAPVTAGQFVVSDGNGGTTWTTVKNGNEVAY